MYTSFIRSTFNYGAPAWYLLISNSNKKKIEILENRILQKILDIPILTRISDLYLESNVDPISVR